MSNPTQTGPDSTTNQGITPDAIAHYLKGAPPESDQFAFFIGEWNCELRLPVPGDAPPIGLKGIWRANWLHDRRILVDDLSVFLPSGEEVLGWVNLRTYCAATGHWEITGQRALEPASGACTTGDWRDGEMHLAFETTVNEQRVQHRVRFFEITPRSFEWEWLQQATPEGEWHPFATLSANRAPTGN